MLKIYAPLKMKKVRVFQSFTSKAVRVFKGMVIVFSIAFLYIVFSCTLPQRAYAVELEKCKNFKASINKEIVRYKNSPITTEIVCGVMSVESSFRTNVVSSYGAVGVMQITLHVLNDYNVYGNQKSPMLSHEILSVQNNIKLGVWYLHRTHRHTKKYAGNESLASALSAYYWGLTRAMNRKLVHTDYSQKVMERHHYFMKELRPQVKNLNLSILAHR